MMPDAWNRRVARLKSRYERGDELELERLIGEAVLAEREACAKIVERLAGADCVYPAGIALLADAIRNRKP